MKNVQEGVRIKLILLGGIIAIIAVILFGAFMQVRERAYIQNTNPELARAMEYEEVKEGDEAVEGTDYVEFDAFFLRDINQDGYAESIRGTCKPIGQDDTLYMELNVQTAGYLKNTKIDINGENFYLQTSLPKDNELKDNYIGNNIKTIEFNDIANGTQKMLTGLVRSGDYSVTSRKAEAIGNNINNYSKINSVTLTGTYVGEDGTEIAINKTVEFNIDWYGETQARIYSIIQNKDITNAIDEEKGELSLDFTVYTEETDKELIISKNHVEGEVPELNGYKPLRVEYTGSNGLFNYDTKTRIFTIDRNAQTNEEGKVTSSISRNNSYGIKIVYPLEAYRELGQESVQIKLPVRTYYEGYNNPNEGFTNPYISNTAESTIIATYEKPAGSISRFEVIVGKYIYQPSSRYIVSKEKPLRIYNGISQEETEDTYNVQWRAYVGTDDISSGIVMQETRKGKEQVTDNFIKTDSSKESTNDIVSNVGIYFSGADGILGEDGWIKVYDAETDELIHEFTAEEWNKYTSNNPYRYELPVKHIRVETSNVIEGERSIYVYSIKEIDDEKLTEKYAKEDFDKLQYIESTLVGYRGEKYINQATHQANYEAPISVANISIENNTISTQTTEENANIKITTETNTAYNEINWKNGTFLVKFPAEIIDVQVNEVKSTSSLVSIESYELIENDEGTFIKIVTNNDTSTTYSIQIDADLTADPSKPTATRNIELYATNENGENYYYSAKDKYDVNNNLNTEERVNYRTASISMVAPNSLITAQTASNFDENGSEVISPEIADLKPVYAVVDQEQKEQTATIGVQIRNNYGDTISEISILGKIPFKGNTYVISGKDLGSTFTAKMKETGIEVPEELKQYVTVYYSENENPTKDVSEQENGWKTAEQVANWDNVKTYLIDLGDFVMQAGDEYVFRYTVKIPNGLEFNQVAFSYHGVYFSLDTDQGKYKTETEPNRLGLRIAEKYDLELTKYQKGRDIVIPGATYRVTDVETGESKTGITNAEGKITISNLYAEKEYEIQEIKTPDDYELSEDIIRFVGHVDENGTLTIEKKQGTTKGDMTVTKQEGENYRVQAAVEDEVKARLRIIKKEQGTDNVIPGVKFEIGEQDKSTPKAVYTMTSLSEIENSKIVTTDENGEIIITGLTVGKEYFLAEIKAEGYYVDAGLNFMVLNNDGKYEFELYYDWNVTNQEVTEENGIPTINLTIENEKIPTYDLQIVKIKKTTESTLSEDEKIANAEADLTSPEVEYLEGAKFRLYKGTELIGEYTTDEQGRIRIPNLYQYEGYEYLDEIYNQIYTLKEVQAPSGYAKVQDITFRAENQDGTIVLKEIDKNGEETESERYSVEGNTVQLVVEDSPTFKLIKKDGETKETLAGVKFAIYNVENGQEPARNSKGEIIGTKETINGAEYYTVTTNAQGEITEDLPEGLYKAVEVKADDKYDISGNVYYFGIGESKELEKEIITEYATNIGDNGESGSVVATKDGGYIVGGNFSSDSITIGDYTLTNKGSTDGYVIKYNANNEVEWVTSVGGNDIEKITSVAETSDGDFVVVGNFWGSIQLGEYILVNKSTYSFMDSDGFIIKYNKNGEVKWADSIEGSDTDRINSVSKTSDGGYIVGGYFDSSSIKVGDYTLSNNGTMFKDGFIAKYNQNNEVEWAETIGGDSRDEVTSVAETSDGGYIVGGEFDSFDITIGDVTFKLNGNTTAYNDGFIVKFNANFEVELASSIGGRDSDSIESVVATKDGGYIVGGNFSSDSITIGDYTLTNNYSGWDDGFVIKYSADNKVEWATSIGGDSEEIIYSVASTSDGGYVIVGGFRSESLIVGNYTLTNKGSVNYSDGYIIKYNADNKVEWASSIGESSTDDIKSVTETNDCGYVIKGNFQSKSIKIGNFTLEKEKSRSTDGFIAKIYPDTNIPEVQELTVENNRKEYQITTDVKEINGVKGGSISGEDENPYETVKYGDSSTKEIVMTPDNGYEIIGITVNGKEYPFKANADGTYTMPAFTNVTENKHIEVTYALTSNKFTISKIDSKTKEPLSGVKFRIENIDEETTNAIEMATNSEGKAITQLEYGRYQITELETADGYKLLDNPIIIDFTRDGNNIVENNNDVNITVNEAGELEIENKETAKVIVHHYLKDKDGTYTTTKVAEDEIIEQTDKEEYTTSPKLDLEKYELEKDENGAYVIPENSKGKFIQEETIEVNYYYVSKEIPLTVHYYIEGTGDSVPLANGGVAEDKTYVGEEGEQYATNSINEDELNERYELVEMPANANGTYEYNEIVVTYYYRLKQSSLLIQKVGDNGEPVAGVTLKIVNKETLREWTYETDNNGKIELMLDNGQYEITEIKAPEEYKLLKNPISVDVELNKENQITIENEKYKEFDFNINKVDSSTGKKISGIKFKLTYTTQYGEQKTEEYVTDENGLAKIPSLYEGIQYQLQEIETIPGYSLDDQIYEFNVEYNNGEYILNTQNPDLKNIQISGNQINVDIENEPTFKLIKEGTKGERVAGAKFTVAYEENELALTDEYVDGILDANGNLIGEVENINGENLRVVTTDENGEIALSLLPGRYVVTEVQAPDGYEMPENELDRSQVIEIESAQVTEISKANELDFNEALNNLNFMFDSIQINTISTYHNGTVIYGVLINDLTIPKTYTSNDEDIVLERGEGIDNGADGIILYIDYSGKVEAVKQIKSEKDTMNIVLTGAENRSGEMIALGYYMNSVTIPAEETESGEQLIISNPEANEETPGVYLVTYNSSNKVKDLRDVTYMLDLIWNGPMMITVSDKYMLMGMPNNNIFTVPAEETVDGKEITINLTGDNPVMLVLNSEGKVISAKEAIYMEINKYNVETETPLITGGMIVGGYADDNVIFTEEETENGEELDLNNTANDAFIVKYNENGKVAWTSKVESEGYSGFVTVQEVSNGYIGIAYYNNDLKIQTVSGEELTFENQEGVVLIKYNAQGQIEWANDISDDMEMFDDMPYIIEQKNGYVLLDYNGSGNSILYNAPNGYTIPIEPVEITITNTTLETLNVPVSKIWDDESNKLGKRPESVIFKLTGSDGSVYTKELTVPGTEGSTTTKDSNNENKWNDIFENIPRFDAEGNWITYTLSEEEKTEGDLKYYDTIIDAKNNIITNTNKYGKVTVHYYIQNPDGTLTTNKVPDTNGTEIQDIVIEGKKGDEYSTEPVENVSDKYELVEEKLPANAEGTLEKYNEEKPQEVIYYYRLKPAKVIINYLEKDGDLDDSNNAILSEQEQIDGYVDDKYNTDTDHRKETISYNGKTYTLVEDSQNTEGTMTVEDIKVTYYYLQNTKATVRYVERDPETHEIIRDLEEPRTEEGLVGDEFVTTEKAFTGYRLVEAPENKTIEMTKEEQTLIYYYEPITTGLVENHIDDITGEVLYTKTHNVQVGQDYNIPNKEFAGYDLVESKLPNNSTGIMGEELVTVNYYYIKKAVLEVNYIDKATGKPLAEQIVDETKHEGDSYTTVEKTFEGYKLIEEPENATGTMEVEIDADGNIVNNRTVVTYYYGKPAEVEEHHIDILTKEELEEPTIHKGYVGEEYNIPWKEFLSYVVAVDDGQGNNMLPENSTGKYTEEKQVVTYYYYQPAKVIVHYVDKTTGKEIQETNEETGKLQSSQVVIEGTKDLDYITTAKEFPYYTLVQRPEKEEGKMKVEITKDENGKDIVNNTIDVYYYYEPKSFNIGVDKTISKITVNGEEQNISNNKLTRVEIYRKNVNDTKVEVEYTIKVTNNEEIDGKAIIRENIPDGMSVIDNDETWEEKDGYLSKVIPEIKAGETKEYKITLAWDGGDKNLGEKNNKVEITQTDNIPGFKDNNDQDNSSEARVLINISTGSIPWPLVIGLLALVGLEGVTLSYARILTNKQKKNRK